jgi:hypothetical protein
MIMGLVAEGLVPAALFAASARSGISYLVVAVVFICRDILAQDSERKNL